MRPLAWAALFVTSAVATFLAYGAWASGGAASPAADSPLKTASAVLPPPAALSTPPRRAAEAKPTGTGVIEGRVVDRTGRPVADAALQATHDPHALGLRIRPRGAKPDLKRPPERSLEALALELIDHRAPPQSTRTDRDGRFRFSHLEDRWFVLRLIDDPRTLIPRQDRGLPLAEDLILDAVPPIPLEVFVRAESGPLASAQVSIESLNERGMVQHLVAQDLMAAMDRPLAIALPPGTYRLTARSTLNLLARQSLPQDVTLTTSSAPQRVELVFPARHTIHGHVLISDQPDRGQQWVVSLIADPPEGEPAAGWASRSIHSATLPREALPRFRFQSIAPGTYAVLITTWHGSSAVLLAAQRVQLVDRDVNLLLPIREEVLDREIAVQVVDSRGQALAGAQLWLAYRFENAIVEEGEAGEAGEAVALAHVLESGRERSVLRYRLPEQHGADDPNPQPLRYVLRAHHAELGSTALELGAAVPAEATIAFRAPETFRLVIPGLRTRLLGAEYSLSWSQLGGLHASYLVHRDVDAADGLTLPRGEPGPAQFRIDIYNSRRVMSWNLLTLTLPFEQRQGEVTAALPPTATLRIEAAPNSKDMWMYLEELETPLHGEPLNDSFLVRTMTEGRTIELGPLRLGRYELHHGDRTTQFVLSGDFTFQDTAGLINALRIHLTDEEGLFARSGFQSGDLIIAIDQQPFQDEAITRAALDHLRRGHPTARLRIARGQSEHELPFSAEALLQDPDRGGAELTPVAR